MHTATKVYSANSQCHRSRQAFYFPKMQNQSQSTQNRYQFHTVSSREPVRVTWFEYAKNERKGIRQSIHSKNGWRMQLECLGIVYHTGSAQHYELWWKLDTRIQELVQVIPNIVWSNLCISFFFQKYATLLHFGNYYTFLKLPQYCFSHFHLDSLLLTNMLPFVPVARAAKISNISTDLNAHAFIIKKC